MTAGIDTKDGQKGVSRAKREGGTKERGRGRARATTTTPAQRVCDIMGPGPSLPPKKVDEPPAPLWAAYDSRDMGPAGPSTASEKEEVRARQLGGLARARKKRGEGTYCSGRRPRYLGCGVG